MWWVFYSLARYRMINTVSRIILKNGHQMEPNARPMVAESGGLSRQNVLDITWIRTCDPTKVELALCHWANPLYYQGLFREVFWSLPSEVRNYLNINKNKANLRVRSMRGLRATGLIHSDTLWNKRIMDYGWAVWGWAHIRSLRNPTPCPSPSAWRPRRRPHPAAPTPLANP